MNVFKNVVYSLNAVIYAVMVLKVVDHYPHNHGYSVAAFVYGFLLIGLVSITFSIFKRQRWLGYLTVLLVSMVICFLCDRFNIIVSYETWTSRGLPEWGVFSER